MGKLFPCDVLSVMQANQQEKRSNETKPSCTPLQKKRCACLHSRGGKGMWRRLLWLCKSCTKCQECSSLFARGSQIPTQGWQLGPFGENGVGWAFGVGSVTTAGVMQERSCSCEVSGPSWWRCRSFPWAELPLLWEQWVEVLGTLAEGYLPVSRNSSGFVWPLFNHVVKRGMNTSLSWDFPKGHDIKKKSKLITHYCVSFQLKINKSCFRAARWKKVKQRLENCVWSNPFSLHTET